nr:hypothetical protein [Tanacetum cinerariifolium]
NHNGTTTTTTSHSSLVTTKYQRIGKHNNYDMLQNILCSAECKIFGILLVDHALTATADVPVVYLQQFWKTVNKVPNTKYTILFIVGKETIMHIVDMFRDTLQLLVETLNNPFTVPADLKYIPMFLKIVVMKELLTK